MAACSDLKIITRNTNIANLQGTYKITQHLKSDAPEDPKGAQLSVFINSDSHSWPQQQLTPPYRLLLHHKWNTTIKWIQKCFNRLYFLEKFLVPTKTEGRAQRLRYPHPQVQGLPQHQRPPPEGTLVKLMNPHWHGSSSSPESALLRSLLMLSILWVGHVYNGAHPHFRGSHSLTALKVLHAT